MSTLQKQTRRILRGVRRRIRRVAGGVRRRWRRSLQLRVVASTLLISAAVVAVLGIFLMQQITDGLLSARREAVLAEAEGDLARVRALINAPPALDGASTNDATLPELAVDDIAQRSSGRYDVIILDSSVDRSGAQSSGSEIRSIPAALDAEVSKGTDDTQYWQYSRLTYPASTTQEPAPGLVVGAKVGSYQVFHLFPLTEEEQALSFTRQTLIAVGLGLVLLLAVIAWLVTRQVVIPVRLAAQAAERLASGRLEERMKPRGEDDLARLATSFNEMAANLAEKIRQMEELSQLQRQFVSDVSHELRTPLTTVRMAADLIYEGRDELDPVMARSAELLQNQLGRFEAMLADLLEISRYDAGAATLDVESVDIRDIVMRAVGGAEMLAERKSTKLVMRLPGEPCLAEVDSRRAERILRNLVVNAIEYGEGRDVVVTVGADRDAVAVAVRDHGIGLKPGQETMVFDRFWRADPARARTTGGTGLGLAIALEDANLHGGWLQAWGSPGEGSQFRLSLPRVAGAELRGSPLPLVPPEIEMRRTWRARVHPPVASGPIPAAPVAAEDLGRVDAP